MLARYSFFAVASVLCLSSCGDEASGLLDILMVPEKELDRRSAELQEQLKRDEAKLTEQLKYSNRLWPSEFEVIEGVGLKGYIAICDDASKIVPALGTPTEVSEIDNVWDGKVDDYDYSSKEDWQTTSLLTIRVKKKTNQVLAIVVHDGKPWKTTTGARQGQNLLDLKRIYGKAPTEEFGFLSTYFEYRKLGTKFSPGKYVTVTDEDGLPRQTQTLEGIEIRKPPGKSCAQADGVFRDEGKGLTWMRCPVGKKHVNGICKGQARKYSIDSAENHCPVGYRLPTESELLEYFVFPDAGTRKNLCANSPQCLEAFGEDKGEYLAWEEQAGMYSSFSFNSGDFVSSKKAAIRCVKEGR